MDWEERAISSDYTTRPLWLGDIYSVSQQALFCFVLFFLFTSLRCLPRKKRNFIWMFCGQAQLRVKTERQRNRTKVIAGALRGNVGPCSPSPAALIPPLSGDLTVMFVISSQIHYSTERFYCIILHPGLEKVSVLLSLLQKFHVH